MIGFITLIPEAEDLARDLEGGEAWHESAIIPPQPGTFAYSDDYVLVADTDAASGPILVQDLPVAVTLVAGGPPYQYDADRRCTDIDGIAGIWYQLADEDMRARFDRKRRLLKQADAKLLALPGYAINAETSPSDALREAQLTLAIASMGGAASAVYATLAAAGVKRERRGKSETEFFTPAELGDAAAYIGICEEVLNLLEPYRITPCMGADLAP